MGFRKPKTKKIGAKILGFGGTGSGKTVFLLSFKKLAVLDSETGIAWYEGTELGKNIELIMNTQDYTEIESAIDDLEDMIKDGDIKTFGIDSETKFYQNLQDVILKLEEDRARKKGRDELDANVSQRGWGKIKSISQRLQNIKLDLSSKGINVVSIAQEDEIKEKQGDKMVHVGDKPSMAKKSEYDYDIVLRFFTEEDFDGAILYKAEVLKDRTRTFKKHDIIDNPSYELWADKIEDEERSETIETSFKEDTKKATNKQETKDEERVDKVEDHVRNIMKTGSTEQKERLQELIKTAKIKNPLKPKDMTEREKLADIIEKVEAI